MKKRSLKFLYCLAAITMLLKPELKSFAINADQQQSNFVMSAGGVIRDKDGKNLSYSKKIVGECTAYTADPSALTSTGVHPKVGLVAVNPKLIPYGTKMYICSADGSLVYGHAVAADTGGALLSGRVLVDLFYNTREECFQFGRRNMDVYILS